MTDVLILGGTGWLSGLVAQRWIGHGAAVTCVARGGRPAPDGADLVVADRDDPEAFAAVAQREWDEVVDISSRAAHVASAVAALSPRARHWAYVSTLSVYADHASVGADESAPLLAPAEPGDEYDYGREKVAAEAFVRSALPDRSAIVRPGLIVGPGDPTDRFGYWVGRFALAGDGPVLVPAALGLMTQFIDVEDVADFVFAAGRDARAGVANAVGDPMPFAQYWPFAAERAGYAGAAWGADDEWLTARDVAHWMGPRSLPLWLPADMTGFATHANAAYRAAGGSFRPLADTLDRTLADERRRGLERERKAGLTRVDELALLAELSAA